MGILYDYLKELFLGYNFYPKLAVYTAALGAFVAMGVAALVAVVIGELIMGDCLSTCFDGFVKHDSECETKRYRVDNVPHRQGTLMS